MKIERAQVYPLRCSISQPYGDANGLKRMRSMDMVNPDLVLHGGIARLTQLHYLADHFGVRLVPHVFDGQIIRTATLHFLSTLPDWRIKYASHSASPLECDISPNPLRDSLLTSPLVPNENGCIPVPTAPGLGVDVNTDLIKTYVID